MQTHLAILHKDYLDKILSGEKLIESRFSKVNCVPHGRIFVNDKVFLKETSGPVVAIASVAQIISFSNMTSDQTKEIIKEYKKPLCLGQDFISRAITAKYITLIYLQDIKKIKPIQLGKRDRRPWVILSAQTSFLLGKNSWQEKLRVWTEL